MCERRRHGDEQCGFALVNRFSSKDLERLYAFLSDAFECMTLELWQRQVEIQPGASQTLAHSYEVIDFADLMSQE